jgi:hypothetical protein
MALIDRLSVLPSMIDVGHPPARSSLENDVPAKRPRGRL